ncbi:acyl-CoA Delta-9 desaturase [Planococcus citri]|uniref:acyl-CoA Delta-9 desaturase n=1 Tax=Planococcus citri TaxID=170843 RepID=UPI0031F97E28
MEDEQENVVHKKDVVWQNVLLFIYLHMSALYGVFLIFTQAHLATVIYTFALVIFSTLSVTLGCHRLWSHNAYQANFFTRLFFIIGHTLTCQGSVYDWVLDHRIHHKYHGTDKDQYNYNNGFLYSFLGSKMTTKHPQLKHTEKDIDMSDIERDSLVMWQKTLYWLLMPIVSILLPINIPVEYFGESVLVSVFISGFLRIALSLHCAWLINSAVILWGLDPVDRRSADTNLIFLVNKSLWPHYHYLVPWDYQVGEYGNYQDGFCNAMIRVLAALGWVTNLRTVDANGVRRALYESTKTGKPIMLCIQQEQVIPTYNEMIADINRQRT